MKFLSDLARTLTLKTLALLLVPPIAALVLSYRNAAWHDMNSLRRLVFGGGWISIIWIDAGMLVGSLLNAGIRRKETAYLEKSGSPPYSYIRAQVRLVRVAAWLPGWAHAIKKVFEEDLAKLSRALENRLGLPALPSLDFQDEAGIKLTREYLRRVKPHLSPRHVEAAREIANDFVKTHLATIAVPAKPRPSRRRSTKS